MKQIIQDICNRKQVIIATDEFANEFKQDSL
jgi:hypothetical protein